MESPEERGLDSPILAYKLRTGVRALATKHHSFQTQCSQSHSQISGKMHALCASSRLEKDLEHSKANFGLWTLVDLGIHSTVSHYQ